MISNLCGNDLDCGRGLRLCAFAQSFVANKNSQTLPKKVCVVYRKKYSMNTNEIVSLRRQYSHLVDVAD